jgi:hypothetical protein
MDAVVSPCGNDPNQPWSTTADFVPALLRGGFRDLGAKGIWTGLVFLKIKNNERDYMQRSGDKKAILCPGELVVCTQQP